MIPNGKPNELKTPQDTGDIRRRIEKGGAAMLATRLSSRVIHAITTLFLMRLLGPDQFGIIGFAVIFKEMVLLASNWGTKNAVIQKGADHKLIASGQLIEAVRATIFFGILYSLAPVAAGFFQTPEVTAIIRISAVLVLISPLSFIPRVRLESGLRFTDISKIGLISTLLNAVVSISLAYQGFEYMAIVYGNVASSLISIPLLWLIVRQGVSFSHFSLDSIKEILGFGFNLTLSGIAMWIYLNMDDFFVGKICGKTILGLYTKAYYIATLPSETIGAILYDVTFPAYVKIKEAPDKLSKAFKETYTFNTTLVLPAVTGIIVLAPQMVDILFGEAWIGLIPILQISCVIGLLRGLYGHANSLIQAIGKPDYFWKVATPQAIVVLVLGYFATVRFGVYGMLWTVVAGMALGFIAYSYLTFKHILGIGTREYARSLIPQLVSTLLMSFLLIAVARFAHSIVYLFGIIGLGAITYFMSLYILGGRSVMERTWLMVRRITGR